MSSQFDCVFSDEKLIENANLFNEFVKVLLDKNEAGTSKHDETNKTILSIADAAKILELVEKNVAEKIHNPSNEATMQIDDVKQLFKNLNLKCRYSQKS